MSDPDVRRADRSVVGPPAKRFACGRNDTRFTPSLAHAVRHGCRNGTSPPTGTLRALEVTMLLAPILAALVAAASPIRSDGQVAAPEGVRFQLPAGFQYEAGEVEGRTLWAAASRDGQAAVAVFVLANERGLQCGADAENGEDDEADGNGGPRMDRVRTAAGLEGCATAASGEGGGEHAMTLVEAGDAIVSVTALTTRVGVARRLARTVADSVRAGGRRTRAPAALEVPAADPRIVGCFERSSSIPGTSAAYTRCYGADYTLTNRMDVATTFANALTRDYEGSSHGNVSSEGRWSYADGTLTVDVGQGAVAYEVKLATTGMILGGQYWHRIGAE